MHPPPPPPPPPAHTRNYAQWETAYTDESRKVAGDAAWTRAGIEFVPMVWGARHVEAQLGPWRCRPSALLGFNEPNFLDQVHRRIDVSIDMSIGMRIGMRMDTRFGARV